MKNICVITGDIINSRKLSQSIWLDGLKAMLSAYGKNPKHWEIYRGDEFQLELADAADALLAAIRIKAFLKSIKADARLGIGIGIKSYEAQNVSESNGTAFVNSGEIFGSLKNQKTTLGIKTGNPELDRQLNLMIRLSLAIIDNWPAQTAMYVVTAIDNATLSQEELGRKLGINQAAVSRRRTRSQLDLIMEFESYYRKLIVNV